MKRERRIPVVTLLLVAVNFIAAFEILVRPDFVPMYGFSPVSPSFLTAFTSLFLHQNLIHLLGNMIFLAAVGASVELVAGWGRFLMVYLVAGFSGVAFYMLLGPHGQEIKPLIGASGCIAGCASYYSVRYLQMRVPLVPKVGVSIAMVTLIWLVLQVVGVFLRFGDEGSSISFWAHIGGFAAGLLLSFVFRAPDIGTHRAGALLIEQMNDRGPAAVVAAAELQLASHPNSIPALKQLADALGSLGEHEREEATLLRILELLPESDQGDTLERLGDIGRLEVIPPLRRTLLAERFKLLQPDVARMLLISVVDGPEQEPQRPDAMLALVGLEWTANPNRAQKLLAELMQNYPAHPAADLARTRGWVS